MVQGSTTQQYKELSYNEMSVSVFIVPDNTQSLSGWLLSPWIHIAGHLEDKSATLTVRLCVSALLIFSTTTHLMYYKPVMGNSSKSTIQYLQWTNLTSLQIIAPKWLCLAKAVE